MQLASIVEKEQLLIHRLYSIVLVGLLCKQYQLIRVQEAHLCSALAEIPIRRSTVRGPLAATLPRNCGRLCAITREQL